jgi:hypothetical protein
MTKICRISVDSGALDIWKSLLQQDNIFEIFFYLWIDLPTCFWKNLKFIFLFRLEVQINQLSMWVYKFC